MTIELTAFQLLTPGLYTADKIQIRVNFRYECNGVQCYTGWQTWIKGKLNGQVMNLRHDIHNGGYGGKDNVLLTFTGLMPKHDLKGELIFDAATFVYPVIKEIARKEILIKNLDDMPPEPEPPGPVPPIVCTEGTKRCKGLDLEICRSNEWVLYKKNATECGYTPPEPEPPEPEPPFPPLPDKEWFEKYKWWILGISAAIIAATFLLLRK